MHLNPRNRRGTGRWAGLAALLALGTLLGSASSPRADLFAGKIQVENWSKRRVGGPDSIAGLGDWALGNGTICAAISAPEHESILSPRGGVLVDLGHCGRGDDQWGVLQPLLNVSRKHVLPVDEVRAQREPGAARIVTRGHLDGIAFETIYEVDAAHPRRLLVRTQLERRAEGDAAFLFGDIALHGNGQLAPFTLSSDHPELSIGFAHPDIDIDSSLSVVRALVFGDLQVLVGGDALEPGIAYGLRLLRAELTHPDGSAETLPSLALNGEHFSMLAAFTRPLWFGGHGAPGLLELVQTPFMEIALGDRLIFERELTLGERADVASVTDQLWRDGPRVHGRVDDPAARLHVWREEGAPVTEVRPASDGRFSFRLPPKAPGVYLLRAKAPGGRTADRRLEIPAGFGSRNLDVGRVAVGRPAWLELPSMGPVRLVFLGEGDTPTPRLGDDLLGFRVGERRITSAVEANYFSLAGSGDDPKRASLPPGRYRVLATRGPEFDVREAHIELAAGETRTLAIAAPIRVFDHAGWLAADLHVHSQASDDSAFPLRRRIAAFAAQGADVLVASEHDRVVDWRPMLRELALNKRMTSVVGCEVTSTVQSEAAPYTFGHANAFPLESRPQRYAGGAPQSENRRLRDLAAELRTLPTHPLLQLNHPRETGVDSGLGAFFTHLSVVGEPFDPVQKLDHGPNRALIERDPNSRLRDVDFDAVELLNGPSMQRYRLTRADWFSLLLQGEVRTGTANSDSHRAGELVALPRNYVAYEGARGDALDVNAFVDSIRDGHLYGSTGPLLAVELGGRGPGERFDGRQAPLRIRVRAAGWVPVDEVRVYVNGVQRARLEVEPPTAAGAPLVRTLETTLTFERDAFVTVEVEGRVRDSDALYALLAPGFTPFAYSNPIFVDADGDGQWRAPGLPDSPPPSLADPLGTP